MSSSGPGAAAAKSAAEAAVVGALGAAAACAAWRGPGEARGIVLGVSSAWAASSVSAAALIVTREVSTKAFWRAFGFGLALRLGTLVGLMAYSVRARGVSAPALLAAYAFGVLAMLLVEYRRVRLR